MSKILSKLKKFLHTPTALESYVASKKPTTAAEVDFWIQQYTYNKFGSLQ
jgi:hypothetical protein